MGERDATAVTEEPAEELFEPDMSELAEEDFGAGLVGPVSLGLELLREILHLIR